MRAGQAFREDAGNAAGRRCLRKSILRVEDKTRDKTLPEHDFVLCFNPAHVQGNHVPPRQRPEKVSIQSLKNKTRGEYLIEGVVSRIHRCPKCPPGKRCYPCKTPRMVIRTGSDSIEVRTILGPSAGTAPPSATTKGNRLHIVVRADAGVFHLVRVVSVLNRAPR